MEIVKKIFLKKKVYLKIHLRKKNCTEKYEFYFSYWRIKFFVAQKQQLRIIETTQNCSYTTCFENFRLIYLLT